jgi:hypothetical protein
MSLTLEQIETRVAQIQTVAGSEFLFSLLNAYGLPKASITRLRSGSYNRASNGDVLWKGKVFYRFVEAGQADLHDTIDRLADDAAVTRERPRFLLVRDDCQLVAVDRQTGDTLDTSLDRLAADAAFFLPWAGIEKTRRESVNPADIKAAGKMALLYNEILRDNEIASTEDLHDLNVFFSRLLFCFFAEDTDVFDRGAFTDAIGSYTATGDDVPGLLSRLFEALDTRPGDRGELPSHLRGLPYVNGRLFAARTLVPKFSAKARRLVLECGELDWSSINPDIFGSMFQGVVDRGAQRETLGMHYTSVENILKVLRPLLLDALELAYAAAQDDPRALDRLLRRLSRIRLFDPACGSGNFLIVGYKELRRLEHRILQRRAELTSSDATQLFPEPVVRLEHFFGIEIDDFAHEIARLSLLLAKHQMNLEYRELFHAVPQFLPLVDQGQIVRANAARIAWAEVLARKGDEEIYLLGNPPYLGGTRQTEEQKHDLLHAFGDAKINKYLDYVSIWLYKGAAYVVEQEAELGFVVTNSVCQGNHVGLLWPHMRRHDAEISFAHSSFLWSNSAKGNAGVTCVVIGLAPKGSRKTKLFYSSDGRRAVSSINAYLVPDGPDLIVSQSAEPLNGLPPMVFGSMPRDAGGLVLSPQERDEILREAPEAERFIRRYLGADEFLKGKDRYCLWIREEEASAAMAISALRQRFERVRETRAASDAASTRQFADQPWRFVQRAHRESQSIIVPRVSSQRREYIPMGFLDHRTVISDAANAIYGAESWTFGLIQARMHMVWVSAVAGRLKTDFRYSAGLVYNTFPVPALSPASRDGITEAVFGVLEARERYSGASLAEMYDPDRMPGNLRDAHSTLDDVVDRLYSDQPFETDDKRLALLFKLYEQRMQTSI